MIIARLLAAVLLVFALLWVFAPHFLGCQAAPADIELVNVSYDATRELYKELNPIFVKEYLEKTGKTVRIVQSHGSSGSQARAVMDGLRADVLNLALAGDIDAVAEAGLIAKNWRNRLPNRSSPFYSTVVFLVRRGNPKQIRDWNDSIRADVKTVSPNPKTSGGARWIFLAAWGYVTKVRGGTETDAEEFIGKMYANVPKLDISARASAMTFVRRMQGDVLLCWENEAILMQREMKDDGLEIIYPSASILAAPPVAWIDKNVTSRYTSEAAQSYLQFLYSPRVQAIFQSHGFRTIKPTEASKSDLPLFTLADLSLDWALAHERFFADGAAFDRIFESLE